MGIIDNFPASHGAKREHAILDAIDYYEYSFSSIKSEYVDSDGTEHTGEFYVFDDALKIEGVRVNVTAETQQKIADKLSCMLMTAKIADMRFDQANTIIKPRPRKITSSTKSMIEHSEDIDDQLKGIDKPGIVSTVGKHWIIDNKLLYPKKPGMAINYGWHFKGNSYQGIRGGLPVNYRKMPGVRMIQTRGSHHSLIHSDYSQICVLVDRNCIVNDVAMDLADVIQDSTLSHLACHDGKMKLWRQPGIPEPNYTFIPTLPIVI